MSKKEIHIIAPPSVREGLDDDYRQAIDDIQKEMRKRGYREVMLESHDRSLSKDEWLYDLPYPDRKKWAKITPLHMDLMIEEESSVAYLMSLLSKPEIEVQKIAKRMLFQSPSFRKLVYEMQAHGGASGSNFGHFDAGFFSHAFYAKGSRMFKLDEKLVKLLDKTDLGLKAPAGFVQPPFANMFIHASPDLTIVNKATGDHAVDGVFLNQYTATDKEVFEELTDPNAPERVDTAMTKFMMDKGLITPDGGEMRVIEMMVTGRPKANMVDDATFSFILMMQDPMTPISDLVDTHCEYYGTKVKAHNDSLGTGIKFENADLQHQQQMRDCIEFVVKALLYINSEESTREKVMALSDLKRELKRTQNKAKQRKIQRKINRSSDYVLIGMKDTGLADSVSSGDGHKRAHWRRGHFREQRYGEGRAELKVIWIKPTLVGKDKPTTKDYVVK